METLCEKCQCIPGIPGIRGGPYLCPICARERHRDYVREYSREVRRKRRLLPKIADVSQAGVAGSTWREIAYVLGMHVADARHYMRKALSRIKNSGCDVSLLFDHVYSNQLFHKPPIEVGMQIRTQIERWQMKADIIEPEAPLEAEAIRSEVAALKKVIK